MSIAVRWLGINALEFRHSHGTFWIDPNVSRNPEKLTLPEEVDGYLNEPENFLKRRRLRTIALQNMQGAQ